LPAGAGLSRLSALPPSVRTFVLQSQGPVPSANAFVLQPRSCPIILYNRTIIPGPVSSVNIFVLQSQSCPNNLYIPTTVPGPAPSVNTFVLQSQPCPNNLHNHNTVPGPVSSVCTLVLQSQSLPQCPPAHSYGSPEEATASALQQAKSRKGRGTHKNWWTIEACSVPVALCDHICTGLTFNATLGCSEVWLFLTRILEQGACRLVMLKKQPYPALVWCLQPIFLDTDREDAEASRMGWRSATYDLDAHLVVVSPSIKMSTIVLLRACGVCPWLVGPPMIPNSPPETHPYCWPSRLRLLLAMISA
jgi:hypothetical protein